MRAVHLLLILFTFGLAACVPAAPPQPAELPQPAVQTQAITPTATPPQAANSPEPTAPGTPPPLRPPEGVSGAVATPLSFSAATYQDEAASFELDYPTGWTVQPRSKIGERGSQALLLSPGTSPETLADGGSRIAMTVYKWDPKKDLAAYLTQRKTAWTSSGATILSETSRELADGRQAVDLVVEGPDQGQSFVLLTTSGEDYLQISGDGNLALIAEIAHTLRPLQAKP